MSKPRKKQGKVASAKSEIVAALPAACASEKAAVEFIERLRWNDSPGCPRCGDMAVYQMKDRISGERNKRYLWRCRGCGEQFSVRTGTVFEDSRIPMRAWAYGFWGACAGKKGISAMQIQRQTGLSYKSALFMMHRIRFAMTPDSSAPKLRGIVESDETWVGGRERPKSLAMRRAVRKATGNYRMPMPPDNKTPVMAMIERGGQVRASVLPLVTSENVVRVLRGNVEPNSCLMTDEARHYTKIGRLFADHQTVKHSAHEYVRGEAHVNSAESFFARLKRQLHGTHHSVSPRHLHRYVAEVVFKHNSSHLEDGERVQAAVQGAQGKRLRYSEPVPTAARGA